MAEVKEKPKATPAEGAPEKPPVEIDASLQLCNLVSQGMSVAEAKKHIGLK